MNITARFHTAQTQQRFEQLKANSPAAIARALNRSIASAKVVGVREISRDLGVTQANLRDKIGTTEARPDALRARLTASTKRIPLVDFNATGPEPSRGQGRGVSAKLGRTRTRYPQAFLATMKSGHRGVFKRHTAKRLPIVELHGPSIGRVFLKYVGVMLARGREQLVKNLQSELRFALRRAA